MADHTQDSETSNSKNNQKPKGSNHQTNDSTDTAEIARRLPIIGQQIESLLTLNHRFNTAYTNLSEVLKYGYSNKTDSKSLTQEEFQKYYEINRLANQAKHKGLGVSGIEEISRKQNMLKKKDERYIVRGPQFEQEASESQTQEVELKLCNWDEKLGNCIGELERIYSTYISRPLRKNEPRYRFLPRRKNMGAFSAVVCLDELEVELIGDEYTKKQDSKHSAALQAINYIESLKLKKDSKDSNKVQNHNHNVNTVTDSDLVTDQILVNQMENLKLSLSDNVNQSSSSSNRNHNRTRGQSKSSKADSESDCTTTTTFTAVTALTSENYQDIDSDNCSPKKTVTQTTKSDNKVKVEAYAMPGPVSDQQLPQHPPMPSNSAILQTLKEADSHLGLPLRIIYLKSLGLDPKTNQMGSGVRSVFVKQLKELKLQGKIREIKDVGGKRVWAII